MEENWPGGETSAQPDPYFGSSELAEGALGLGQGTNAVAGSAGEQDLEIWLCSVAAHRDFEVDLERARRRSKGTEHFARFSKSVRAVLTNGYVVLIGLEAGGTVLVNSVIADLMKDGGRIRAPKRSNLPLLAMQIAAEPQDEAQQKTTSEWSTLLQLALSQRVEPDNFPTWVAAQTLTGAKKAVRAERAQAKAIAQGHDTVTAPNKASGPPLLEVRYPSAAGPLVRVYGVLDDDQAAALCALVWDTANELPALKVVGVLLNALKRKPQRQYARRAPAAPRDMCEEPA